ncbi:helix-turn-helix domain-containing protein [Pelosinus baikalensis]|uniref:Helix-turn-helix domain-containing protein n=1 Tax=Pelosinus baikalensis TaxID=2892015 RepID=A0ABS8HWV7_9FIRM|nr:helix-turn-helix transcriptional regulator [Pelosinus baikalensis]MCC5467662.1 helix-turn-helix domain-containing protein [Pelosinus baikalensis]
MLGERLKQLREQKKLTQQELADALNISRGTYAHYEINRREPDDSTKLKIADFFDVTTDYLLGRTDEPNTVKKIQTIAAHRTDDPMSDLPPEAIRSIEEFKELMRIKYGKKPT